MKRAGNLRLGRRRPQRSGKEWIVFGRHCYAVPPPRAAVAQWGKNSSVCVWLSLKGAAVFASLFFFFSDRKARQWSLAEDV